MWTESGNIRKKLVRLGKHLMRYRGKGKELVKIIIKIMSSAWPVGKSSLGELLSLLGSSPQNFGLKGKFWPVTLI